MPPVRLTPPTLLVACLLTLGFSSFGHAALPIARQVIVPGEDRFSPFAITIRAGQSVQWVNLDTDDHTVVSNDFFNTAGHNGTNVLLKGTDSNGGVPGTLTLNFRILGRSFTTVGSMRISITFTSPSRPVQMVVFRIRMATSAHR